MKRVYIGTNGAELGDMITFETHELMGVTRTEIRPGVFQAVGETRATRHVGMITSLVTSWNGNTPKISFTITGGESFDVRPDFVVESM